MFFVVCKVFGWRRTPAVSRAREHSRGRVRAAERRGAGIELGLVGRRSRLWTGPVEQSLFAAKTVSTRRFFFLPFDNKGKKTQNKSNCRKQLKISLGNEPKSMQGGDGISSVSRSPPSNLSTTRSPSDVYCEKTSKLRVQHTLFSSFLVFVFNLH